MDTEKITFLDRVLLAKPTHRMAVEWPILVIVAVLGEMFSWSKIPFSPYSNILGGIVIVGALTFHAYCHRAHRKAHEQLIGHPGHVPLGQPSLIGTGRKGNRRRATPFALRDNAIQLW